MSMPKLAIVISHPIQHFAPLYAQLSASTELELKVFFIAENGLRHYHDQEFGTQVKWDVPLTEGYPHEFVEPGNILDDFSFLSVDSRSLVEKVEQFKPDFIWLHGYAQRANWRVLLARPNNARIIYSSDSNLADHRSWLRTVLKKQVIAWFFKRCQFYLSISPSNREYLDYYGASREHIIETTFPIDIARIKQQKQNLSEPDRLFFKKSITIPDGSLVLLYVGKLIAHKRPQDVIEALARDTLKPETYAVIVGSGSMQNELEILAKQKGVYERCRFVGFVNQGEMVNYFSIADLFVFPSEREPYGAIAAETLPFGIPMIVAEGIGAIGVSVIDGTNALLYPSGDIAALTKSIARLASDIELRARFSEASVELADKHDKSRMAHDIIALCKSSF